MLKRHQMRMGKYLFSTLKFWQKKSVTKIHNSTFSNQNLRIEYDFFLPNQMEKEIKIFHRILKIEFGKEILDLTKQCALSWNHSLLITLTRDILWRFYVVAVWQILFQFRKKNIYEKDTFLKKDVAAINMYFIYFCTFLCRKCNIMHQTQYVKYGFP